MTAEVIISELRKVLAEMKERGQTAVMIAGLEEYFSVMEKEDAKSPMLKLTDEQRHELSITQLELDNEKWKVNTAGQFAIGLELFKAVIEAGQTAVKSLIVMNGAAAIALLAFLGNILSRGPNFGESVIVGKINTAMIIFFAGVGFAGATSCFRYLSQALYADRSRPKRGDFTRNIAVTLAVFSLVAFLYGGFTAYKAFSY